MLNKRDINKATDLWAKKWFLLTAGDFSINDYNTMTVAWGSIGTMWSKPFVQVVVRPSRYTYDFMNKYDTFTLTAFDEKYRKSLRYLGAISGRNQENKIEESGLTPVPAICVDAPSFKEACCSIECSKMYWQDMDSSHFLHPDILSKYPGSGDFHRIYFGEILHIECKSQ